MPDVWIAPAKLAAPEPPAGWLRRSRPARPLRVLAAGPGWGKTLALLAAHLDARDAGHVAVWYACDPDDADPATFFPRLVAAVRAHVPPFGAEVLGPLEAGKLDEAGLWARFFGGLAAYGLPGFHLALDDAQALGPAPALLAGLVAAFDRPPAGVGVAIATRTRLTAPLGRLTARGAAETLGPEALRFTPDEEAAFLAARGIAAPLPAMEGWPLGIDLASGLGAALPAGQAVGRAPGAALADYLAEEVLAALGADRRAALEALAWLGDVGADAVTAVFGLPDAPAALEALAADHLAFRLPGGAYRVPAYMRDLLLADLARTRDAATRAAWHRAAATFFAPSPGASPGAGGDPGRALPHLVAAGDFAAAAALCQRLFPTRFARGEAGAIARQLDAFPPAVRASEPVLAYWDGQLLGRAGRGAEAVAAYERALAGFRAREDAAGELRALGRLATRAMYAGDQRRAGQLLMQALGRLADAGDAERADFHLTRGASAEQRGDLALMRECNEAVLALPVGRDIDVAICRTIAHQNLCTWALHRGELARAADHARQAEAEAAAWGFHPTRLAAGFLGAHVRLLEGDIEAAAAWVRGLEPGWEDALDWHDLGVALTILGQFHQVKGDAADAERAFERARATFAQAGFPEGEKVPLERQLWLAAERRQHARAAELFRTAPAAAGSVFDLALAAPAAWARGLSGDRDGALALLAEAAPGLAALEAWPALGRLKLVEAALTGERGPAEAFLEAHGLGFLRTEPVARVPRRPGTAPLPAWATIAALVPAAPPAAAPSPTPGAAPDPTPAPTPGLVTGAASTSPAPAPAGSGPSPAASAVAPAAAPATTRAAPEGRLVLTLLGDLVATLDGVRLDAWPRKKAKVLLAALALYPRGLAATALAELLVGGEAGATAGSAASQIVQTNVSALRKALAAYGKDAVTFADDRYALAPGLGLRTDVQAFERALGQGPEGLDAALAAYGANLLDEPFFEPHFHAERARLQDRAVDALARRAARAEALGDFTAALADHERAARLAPTDEGAAMRLMAFHAARRAPERVRHAYWDYRKALKTRLGLAPDEAFERAYREALQDRST